MKIDRESNIAKEAQEKSPEKATINESLKMGFKGVFRRIFNEVKPADVTVLDETVVIQDAGSFGKETVHEIPTSQVLPVIREESVETPKFNNLNVSSVDEIF